MAVLVTGASGYIALHVIKLLLSENYKVIGTVRSQAKADKITKQFNNPNLSFEIVTDISKLDAFDKVLEKHAKEIDSILHMASPLPVEGNTDYENYYLLPAVNGSKGILNAIKRYAPHTVKRVVLTSSIAAMIDINNPSEVTTEKSWDSITWEQAQANPLMCYFGSKTYAEKAVWEFVKENEDKVDFKLVVINPTMVWGKQLFDENVSSELNVSNEMVNKVLHLKPTDTVSNEPTVGYVHVDDVAKAHVLGIQKDELIGKRLLMATGGFSDQSILNSILKQFPQLKDELPPYVDGADVAKFNFDSTVTQNLLGFKLKGSDEAIYDIVHQVLKIEGKL